MNVLRREVASLVPRSRGNSVSRYPSSKKRNLEKIDRDHPAGTWRISALLDPITEKKFRLFSLGSRALANFSPVVLSYRSDAAYLIGGTRCASVVSTALDGDRVEILTPWFDLLDLEHLDDTQLAGMIDALLRTFALFEKHCFFANELFPEAIGRDESGGWVLLPPAYATPVRTELHAPVSGGRALGGSRARAAWESFEYPEEADRRSHHIALVAEFVSKHIRPLPAVPSPAIEPAFRTRLIRTAESIVRGEIASTADAYERLFGAPPEESLLPRPLPTQERDVEESIRAAEERVEERVMEEGSVTVLEGAPLCGKTRIIGEIARRLRGKGERDVFVLDEWDLYAKTRSKLAHAGEAPATGKSALPPVWLIDDIDEKMLASSEFSNSMAESDSFPRGSVVISVQPSGASQETMEFLGRLKNQRAERCQTIALHGAEEPLGDYIESVLGRLESVSEADRSSEGEPIDLVLSRLSAEERQLLEFLAVARFSLPLDVVLSVFPEREHGIPYAAHRLISLEMLAGAYRPTPPKSAHTLFLGLRSGGLRRLIYERISPARRRTLHRTLALAAEEPGYFPACFLLFHALKATDADLAARHLVRHLKDTKGEKRDPFVIARYTEIVDGKVIETLPFGDRVLACYRISQDLFKSGKAAAGEGLLLECLDFIENAEVDQKLKSATLVSASLRLLADWWERRGEYKRALELLDSIRFELQSALSIPDQARLLNDIGWLQYRLGDYDGSMESCRLSLNTLNPNQYPLIVAQALNLMGVVHYNSSRYDEAISYYEQSARLRERAGDENAAAASFNNLALAYQAKAEYEKALEYYNTSLMLKRRQNNRAGIAAGYLNLALLFVDMRNFKEAEAKCRESLAVCEMLDEVHAQAIPGNYMTLGDIAVEQGDLRTAGRHYTQSLDIARKMGAINEEMGAYRRLSSIALKEKRYDEAREYAGKAFDLVQRIGSKYENAQIEEILGDLEIEQGRQTEALEHYEKAAGQYTSLSKYRYALKALSKIGLVHAASGNTFEARHYLDRAQDYVRADIGRELPQEYSALQRQLRGAPAPKAQLKARDTQRIMTAFYDLSALTDYARDVREFFTRVTDAVKEIVSPNGCTIALKTGSDRFVTVDPSGIRQPLGDKGLNLLFKKTLLLGALLDSRSPDAADAAAEIGIPPGHAFVSIPLKTMGEEIGCLFVQLDSDRLPLSKQDDNLFVWFGRQIAANLILMLHLNEGFLREDALETHEEEPRADAESKQRFENLIGKSEPMKKIFRTLEKIKNTDSGILILGESGTGKSALARAIHYRSPRRNRPFREIHCAQIPFGLLESELFGHERGAFTGATQRKMGLCEMADGGTLFLDDINVVPNEIQAKLLRFIENKTFVRLGGTQDLAADVRIVAASNEDLEALCREGRFREDLYFRLKVILIDLPPLRERPEDTIAIALDYLKRSCGEKGIPLKTLSPETIRLLQKAPWRGNVRELQNVLERVVILCDDTIIVPEALPEDFLRDAMGMSKQSHRRLDELVEEIIKLGGYSETSPLLPMLEALIVKKMVGYASGKGQAAQLLGISKPTLYARLRDYEKMR